MKELPLILFAIVLNTLAQIGLKIGMTRIGYFEFSGENLGPIAAQLIRNPYVMGSVFIYCLSLITWLMVLSRVEVSLAYPLTSLGYVFTALAGYFFLQEDLSLTRFMGIVVIIIGVYLVARR